MKKLAIIGKGTAGAQTVAHFNRHLPNWEIEWHYDPNIPTQAVGEGTVPILPGYLSENINFQWKDLPEFDGTIKTGIFKSGWNQMPDFIHTFQPPSMGMHFNAKRMQDFIAKRLEGQIKVVEHNTSADQLDANYIIDCSGRPKDFTEFETPEYIPVNSVHVNQCYWDRPEFDYTLTIARPYGWVFGIPLKNRCSIGYLYNNNINTLEEVKEDIKNIFERYNLTPSEDTNSFTFGNYYRKQNYTDRISYNGNASFFLEPMEATSFALVDHINRNIWELLHGNTTTQKAQFLYKEHITDIEEIIMMHYFAGSEWDTPFWDFAKERGENCMKRAMRNSRVVKMFKEIDKTTREEYLPQQNSHIFPHAFWTVHSFYQNINGLGIKNKLKKMLYF